MLKVVHLSSYDIKGGAARAAYRLNIGLQAVGVDSVMLVQDKASDDDTILCKNAGRHAALRPLLNKLPLLLYPKRTKGNFSPSFVSDNIQRTLNSFTPDIIHLHWINDGFLQIETLDTLGKPIVWTLHDMWAFTGGCHYDDGCAGYRDNCGRCPQLGSKKEYDFSRRIWLRKKKAWNNLDITIVTPSKWLLECAKASSIFSDRRMEVIPNALNIDVFKPLDIREARESLSLPEKKKLVLFGLAGAMDDNRKGFYFLMTALKELAVHKDNLDLVIFGIPDLPWSPYTGLKSHCAGRIDDDTVLSKLYSAADVFVAPSLQDNLPNTVMESLACGTPVVAFNTGGIPDMVEHRINGYLAKPFDTADLANGIKWVLDVQERNNKLGAAAREKAVKKYSLERQARHYLRLYDELLENG